MLRDLLFLGAPLHTEELLDKLPDGPRPSPGKFLGYVGRDQITELLKPKPVRGNAVTRQPSAPGRIRGPQLDLVAAVGQAKARVWIERRIGADVCAPAVGF